MVSSPEMPFSSLFQSPNWTFKAQLKELPSSLCLLYSPSSSSVIDSCLLWILLLASVTPNYGGHLPTISIGGPGHISYLCILILYVYTICLYVSLLLYAVVFIYIISNNLFITLVFELMKKKQWNFTL